MLIACFPAYFLSTLWAMPGLVFNIIGLVAALMQLVAFIYFIKIVRSIPASMIKNVSRTARLLFAVAFLSFILKLILQTWSAHPHIAQLAYEIRNYVMAYLHLVLLGMVTCFLLGWSLERKWIHSVELVWVFLFAFGFAGMEITLISTIDFTGLNLNSSSLLLGFSFMILAGIAGFLVHSFRVKEKN